jgi:hypothetical protein
MSRPGTKNIPLNPSGKSVVVIRPSHPRRGGSRVVTNARWDAMDATASGAQGVAGGFAASDRPARGRTALPTVFARTCRIGTRSGESFGGTGADGEVVWSWRPKLAPSSWDISHGRRWQQSSAHRGDHEVSRNTIARGKPDERLPCGLLVRFVRTTAGAIGARLSLRPSFEGG